jgi:hypothetical protein
MNNRNLVTVDLVGPIRIEENFLASDLYFATHLRNLKMRQQSSGCTYLAPPTFEKSDNILKASDLIFKLKLDFDKQS